VKIPLVRRLRLVDFAGEATGRCTHRVETVDLSLVRKDGQERIQVPGSSLYVVEADLPLMYLGVPELGRLGWLPSQQMDQASVRACRMDDAEHGGIVPDGAAETWNEGEGLGAVPILEAPQPKDEDEVGMALTRLFSRAGNSGAPVELEKN